MEKDDVPVGSVLVNGVPASVTPQAMVPYSLAGSADRVPGGDGAPTLCTLLMRLSVAELEAMTASSQRAIQVLEAMPKTRTRLRYGGMPFGRDLETWEVAAEVRPGEQARVPRLDIPLPGADVKLLEVVVTAPLADLRLVVDATFLHVQGGDPARQGKRHATLDVTVVAGG